MLSSALALLASLLWGSPYFGAGVLSRRTSLWAVDSVVIGDVRAGGPLEAVLAEQGGNNAAIAANHNTIFYRSDNPDNPCCAVAGECAERDCDKVAIGDFAPGEPGLEVFCRSACGRAPWVFDAQGQIIAQWIVDDTRPADWYIDGIEEVGAMLAHQGLAELMTQSANVGPE